MDWIEKLIDCNQKAYAKRAKSRSVYAEKNQIHEREIRIFYDSIDIVDWEKESIRLYNDC